MWRKKVPIQKLGTPFQRPAWRYDALRNPERYGFRNFCSKKKSNSGFLKRFIAKGLTCKVTYTFPEYVRALSKNLPTNLSQRFDLVWRDYWKRSNKYKVLIEGLNSYEYFTSWNLKRLPELNDEWLQRLILHIFNVQYSPEIETALRIYTDESQAQIKRYLGHQIFAEIPDVELAKQWKLPVRVITAFRKLFFDFSSLPKEKVSRWATLVQLANSGDIPAEEFALYKRIFELGPVGLKAQVAGYALTDEERDQVTDYLAKSATVNTFNLNFAVRTSRDALVYNRVISDLARLHVQKAELKIREKEQQLMELQISKMNKEIGTSDAPIAASEDLSLLQEAIVTASKYDFVPKFRTPSELQEVKAN